MTPTAVGIIGMLALLALLFVRMPIGLAMALVGAIGVAVLHSPKAALNSLGSFPYSHAAVQAFAVIPLFVLMGNFAAVSGMGRDLYAAAYAWLGHHRGGLASATVLACAGFAALSGSSVASAVTMGRVCLPEMQRYAYDPRLATGVIAAGGTLGILIPPSTVLVVYALLTEESIGRLFLAGFLPGVMLTALFVATVMVLCLLRPDMGPPGNALPLRERIAALGGAAPFILVVAVTIGGIYAGVFTVNEAAAVGALLTMAHALWRRALGLAELTEAVLHTVRTTAMVFLILIGAHIFSPFLALSRIPVNLASALTALELPAFGVLGVLLVAYLILGMFLEGFAMMVLTVPIVFPIIQALGVDPIWFGIFMVIVLEMGLISPPVGINVYIVKGIAEEVPMSRIFEGIMPFWVAMLVCVLILIVFPQVAMVLPDTMMR
ncbi:MAG: C4-dicarboxylate ABC transporter permease [Betaproteobacteria bacterium RIFCSPLOWO2_02_FULL_63_19]|nr:MAG: C4-dicarboxylate ABC transporter permease [Betaproteobacteria bacterium RIFCSPLOWO2_02_FULL_63_19]